MNRAISLFIVSLIFATATFGQSAGVAKPADPLNLDELVREAMERNPEILAARRNVDAKRAHIPQAGAWADPTVSLSYAGNAVPPFTVMRGDPSSIRQVMAEQMIPYPGKNRLRTQIAARDADAETLAYEDVSRRIAAEVKQAYFDLAFVDLGLANLQKDRDALEGFEKVTEIRYSVGKAMQQDVLRAQLEVTKLAQRAAMLGQQRRILEAQVNQLRNASIEALVGAPGAVQPSALVLTQDQLLAAAEANYPVLRQRQTPWWSRAALRWSSHARKFALTSAWVTPTCSAMGCPTCTASRSPLRSRFSAIANKTKQLLKLRPIWNRLGRCKQAN